MSVPLDPALARIAASLPVMARRGDEAGIARLTQNLAPYRAARLWMVIAGAADPDEVLARSGVLRIPARDAHAAFWRYQKRGVRREDMPLVVRRGETVYQRLAKRAQAARKTVEARESA